MECTFKKGLAFIVEGDTEKEFYLSMLSFLCEKHGATFERKNIDDGTDVSYVIKHGDTCILAKFNGVNAISQIPQAGRWFNTQCISKHKKDVPGWDAILCYDTDNYKDDVTKFQEGDWLTLRTSLKKAQTVLDLAAAADIEDVMLVDLEGVCAFIGCEIPEELTGRKGNVKLRNIFRDHDSAYHKGKRARPLIDTLDKQKIIDSNIIPLEMLEQMIFN